MVRLFVHRYSCLLGRADSRQREHERSKNMSFQEV
jgi:hypothetical protein